MDRLKWDQRFLALARFTSTWSKDPSTKVGAVIADGKRIVSLGFNGLPSHIPDDPEILNNREEKYKHIIHAEENAISFASRDIEEELFGLADEAYTIYTYPFMPCLECAWKICDAGIPRVVSVVNSNPRWRDSFLLAEEFFKQKDIELVLYENLIEEV